MTHFNILNVIHTSAVNAVTGKANITYTDVRTSRIVTSSICMTRISQTLVDIFKIGTKSCGKVLFYQPVTSWCANLTRTCETRACNKLEFVFLKSFLKIYISSNISRMNNYSAPFRYYFL